MKVSKIYKVSKKRKLKLFKQGQAVSCLNPSQELDTELESAETEQIVEIANPKRGADEVDWR